MLAAFDSDGDSKLYHFRFLPAERRAAAAQHIVANQLDPPVSSLQCCLLTQRKHAQCWLTGCLLLQTH